MAAAQLAKREIRVLEAIVRNYILTASPTGSRFIARQPGFDLSAATIRNVMGDLEEWGYITHPHTSAGRVPTDKGYRFYVDCLMRLSSLPQKVRTEIRDAIQRVDLADLHVIMEATSRALSKATSQLGVILAPRLNKAVFRHVHIHGIDGNRFLMNLAIDSGFVKSLIIELTTSIDENRLALACQILNERFYQMSLQDMSEVGDCALSDIEPADLGIIRLFVPSIKRLIAEGENENVYTQGETNILLQPEFFDREKVGAVIEFLEEKQLLMHLVETGTSEPGRVIVSIGGEIDEGKFNSFSIIKTTYKIGGMEGRLGIIGPKRMPYPFLVSAVDFTARTLAEVYSHSKNS